MNPLERIMFHHAGIHLNSALAAVDGEGAIVNSRTCPVISMSYRLGPMKCLPRDWLAPSGPLKTVLMP